MSLDFAHTSGLHPGGRVAFKELPDVGVPS